MYVHFVPIFKQWQYLLQILGGAKLFLVSPPDCCNKFKMGQI